MTCVWRCAQKGRSPSHHYPERRRELGRDAENDRAGASNRVVRMRCRTFMCQVAERVGSVLASVIEAQAAARAAPAGLQRLDELEAQESKYQARLDLPVRVSLLQYAAGDWASRMHLRMDARSCTYTY